MTEFFLDVVDGALGPLWLAAAGGKLCSLAFDSTEAEQATLMRKRFGQDASLRRGDPDGFGAILRRYLQGERRALEAIPVDLGGTPFQRSVWAALREIPCGSTTSYGALAKSLGKPAAMRAVGLANGQNPAAIVVPCHRVIGANGSLTGYGGGLDRKRWLLKHEGALLA